MLIWTDTCADRISSTPTPLSLPFSFHALPLSLGLSSCYFSSKLSVLSLTVDLISAHGPSFVPAIDQLRTICSRAPFQIRCTTRLLLFQNSRFSSQSPGYRSVEAMQLTNILHLALVALSAPSSALVHAYYPLYPVSTGTAPYYPLYPTGTGTAPYYPTGPTGTGTGVGPTATGTATIGTGYAYPTAALKRVARRAELMDGRWA